MKFRLLIIILSGFILTFSCKNDNTKNGIIDSLKVDIIDTDDSLNIIDSESDKTRIIADTQVLFFMPSPQEKQKLIKFYGTYNQYEFQAIFNNFSILSKNIKKALQKQAITVEVTYAKKFIFLTTDDTLIYDLKLENQFMGYILADGVNTPLIRNGVPRTKDVSNDIRNYYNIVNFNIFD